MTNLKLLIVEDDQASLELMTEVFTSLKAEVLPVSEGRQAAALVNTEKFDGILMDLQMPDMHGFELAQRVRESAWNKATPIIIVTGYDSRNAMQQAFATGATFFLQKPVDRQKLTGLFRTVRGALLDNRRKYTRIPFQTQVACQTESRSTRGLTWNLSLGGIQIANPALRKGEQVQLSFALPGTSIVIDALGEVQWAEEDRRGIRFVRLSQRDENEIKKLIAQVATPEEFDN